MVRIYCEDLLKLIHEDWKFLEQSGINHEQIALALEKAMETGELPNSDYRLLYPGITSGGGQPCPWDCRGVVGNGMHFIMRKDKEREIMKIMSYLNGKRSMDYDGRFNDSVAVFTELHPHLYREHRFFEGRMTPFRTDPQLLIDAFCLG